MKKSKNNKLLKPILEKSRNNVVKKSKQNKPTKKNITYDFTLLNELFEAVEIGKFIKTELKRIAEDYKIPESTVALYAGKRFIWNGYCSKEEGYVLEKLQGDELINEIMNIVDSKEAETKFDYAKFFQGVDGDLAEDFATLQLSKLPIWDELLEDLEGRMGEKNEKNQKK